MKKKKIFMSLEDILSIKFSVFSPYVNKFHPFSKKGLRFYDVFHKILQRKASKVEIAFAKRYAKAYAAHQ